MLLVRAMELVFSNFVFFPCSFVESSSRKMCVVCEVIHARFNVCAMDLLC